MVSKVLALELALPSHSHSHVLHLEMCISVFGECKWDYMQRLCLRMSAPRSSRTPCRHSLRIFARSSVGFGSDPNLLSAKCVCTQDTAVFHCAINSTCENPTAPIINIVPNLGHRKVKICRLEYFVYIQEPSRGLSFLREDREGWPSLMAKSLYL